MKVVTPAHTPDVTQPGPTAAATAALLWAACRPSPDDAACEDALRRGADLSWASRVAVAQRVSPLLWRAVQRWSSGDDGWSVPLREDSLRCKAQALMLRPRLGTHLFEPLAAAGIEPMVIKGLAVAERYPEPGLRPMDDVDLLVRAGEHRDAAEILRRAGWRTTRRQGPAYSLSLGHPAMPGLPVDLHLDLAVGAEQVFRFTADDLWRARRPVTLFGAPVLVPDPEVELLLMATHAGKPFHNFDRLLWAVDAAVIIAAAASDGREVDWDRLGESTSRAAARSALAVLLAQADRLGAGSPAWLREVRAGTARRRVLDPTRALTWPVQQLGEAERRRLTFAVIDDPRLRLRHFMHQTTRFGLIRTPDRMAVTAWWILRRIWRLRRMAAQVPAGTSLRQGRRVRSAEQSDEQVDPVVADGQP